jgi:hypothetical protein
LEVLKETAEKHASFYLGQWWWRANTTAVVIARVKRGDDVEDAVSIL